MPAKPGATASTSAATANSKTHAAPNHLTRRRTRPPTIRLHRPTNPGKKRVGANRPAASSATSPAASTGYSRTHPHQLDSQPRGHTHDAPSVSGGGAIPGIVPRPPRPESATEFWPIGRTHGHRAPPFSGGLVSVRRSTKVWRGSSLSFAARACALGSQPMSAASRLVLRPIAP